MKSDTAAYNFCFLDPVSFRIGFDIRLGNEIDQPTPRNCHPSYFSTITYNTTSCLSLCYISYTEGTFIVVVIVVVVVAVTVSRRGPPSLPTP